MKTTGICAVCKSEFSKLTSQSKFCHRHRSAAARHERAVCPFCNKEFNPTKAVQVYCSAKCRSLNQYSSDGRLTNGIAPGTTGAIHELFVCADLLLRRFSVFRSVSPNSTCDILILHGESCFRIEVTTGYKLKSGKIFHPGKDSEKHDFLAVVHYVDGHPIIRYSPDLPIIAQKAP